jgi:hypothetical protein
MLLFIATGAGLPDFSWYNIPKRGKIYQITIKYTKWPQNIPNCRKVDPMAIKYSNIFHCKTLQNLPKMVILVWKQIIWQPWPNGWSFTLVWFFYKKYRTSPKVWDNSFPKYRLSINFKRWDGLHFGRSFHKLTLHRSILFNQGDQRSLWKFARKFFVKINAKLLPWKKVAQIL